MVAAIEIFFIDLPMWVGVLLITILLVVGALFLRSWYVMWREERHEGEYQQRKFEITFPYYVETQAVQNLAQAVNLDIPMARSVTKSRSVQLGSKGASGKDGRSETNQYDGFLPLSELAKAVANSWSDNNVGPAVEIANSAYVSDERVLSTAIEQIARDFPETSQTAELLQRVRKVFSGERIEALASKKRAEFAAIAKRNQTMIFKGQLGSCSNEEGSAPVLRLTDFNPTHGFALPDNENDNGLVSPGLIPVPEGVALRIVLPDPDAVTPAGQERMTRPEPFYAGVIAHSPSFDDKTGTLTCSAWAIWGESVPDWVGTGLYEPGVYDC